MQLAIFGISNGGLDLVANLFVMGLVVVWLALIAWTYFDARRRIKDPVLVACATGASLFPYIGTFVYSILRPPEYLEDAKERALEIKAAELRVRQLSEMSCPNCHYPTEKSYLRCPNCQRRLKDPCQSCGKPVDPRWALCPYCETALPGSRQQRREPQRATTRSGSQRAVTRRTPVAQRPAAKRSSSPTPGKGGADASGDADPSDAPRRTRAARRK